MGYAPEEVMGQVSCFSDWGDLFFICLKYLLSLLQNLVEQFITPEHRARVQSVIDEALAGEETANFEESVQLLV